MTESYQVPPEDFDPGPPVTREEPRHGFQGDRGATKSAPEFPAGLTVAISREAGSRGGSIARRAGQRLGWQVYPQELLEYIAQEGSFRQQLSESLTPAASAWVDAQFDNLLRAQDLSRHPSIMELARMVLSLGVSGEVVLLGRGAGYILPPRTTLHVRLIAPLADRIAYMSQWLRLTHEEAVAQVRLRDSRRAEFISTHFHRKPSDIYQYDLLLNTTLLGEELCADMIVRAAQAKQAALGLTPDA
jgi:cytidylate kinase